MYDELVKSLRATRERVMQHPEVVIYVPPYQLSAAADAVEELSKQVELEYQSGFADGQIAANRKKRRWIPVTEQLPDVMTTVIVSGRMKYAWEKDFVRFVDVATYDGVFFETCNDWYEGQQYFDIVYWMPLPEPPTA